jgi:poly-gamma-glutamate synthesis protein (capsule biosynthesis protein)
MDYNEIKRKDAEYMRGKGKRPPEGRTKRPVQRRKKNGKGMMILIFILALIAAALAAYIWTNSGGGKTSDNENTPAPTENTEAAQTAVTEKPTETVQPTPEITAEPMKRGTSETIPQEVKDKMMGVSYPSSGNAEISLSELTYLTIPYKDFNGNSRNGHMIVAKAIADEVLDIFEELYEADYPIEKMELVDEYDGDDYTSIDANNTSAFNYRESTDGSGRLSQHAMGRAIDINPQINPYVDSSGKGSHQNARQYWSRTVSDWDNETAKRAYIGTDTEIYKIFTKYGWEWGGSWSSYRDYQHFQKKK